MTLPLNRYRSLLAAYLKPQGMSVLLLVVLLLSNIGLELVNPQILAIFIDTATMRGTIQTLVYLALAFLVVAILGQMAAVVETYVAENVGLTATNKLRADLTLHCLRLDPAFHAAHTPGELIERVDGDVGTLSNFFSRFVVALLGNAILLVGVLGIYLFRTGAISIGTVYLIFSYTTLLSRPMDEIVRQIEDLQKASASITRVSNVLDMKSSIKDGRGEALPPGPLPVELLDVSFSYVDDVFVLKHISLSLKPGMVLGLLGRTGSGKTTLTKLLVRLYDPTAGIIRLGDVDPRDMRLDDLRKHVGVVTQDIQLFHATVRDNLTLFDRGITDERIAQVLEDLGLSSWYRSLQEGLNTMLAPGGGLSAGEAQLLAFARVFLKDPGLVILDEASSRLDLATERRLEHAIDALLERRTGIIIAHRLATVQRADMIMILDGGQCCEYGPREALASNPASRFSQLLRTGLEEILA